MLQKAVLSDFRFQGQTICQRCENGITRDSDAKEEVMQRDGVSRNRKLRRKGQ